MAKHRSKTKSKKAAKSRKAAKPRKVNNQDLSMPPDHDLATCEDWAFDILEQEMNARLARSFQKNKGRKQAKTK